MKKLILAVLFALLVSVFSVFAMSGQVAVSPPTVDPGNSMTVTVAFTNDDPAAYTIVTLSSTNPFGGSLGTVGSFANVPPNESRTLTFSVPVSATQTAGSYTGTVTIDAVDASANTYQATGTFTFTVNAKPSLSFVESSLSLTGQPGQATQKTFSVKNTGNTVLSNIVIGHERAEIKDANGRVITLRFSPATITSLASGVTQAVTLTVTVEAGYNLGSEADKVKVDVPGMQSILLPFTIDVKPVVCVAGNVGRVDIDIVHPDSSDDVEAGTLIPVEIEVENKDSRDHDIVLKAVLYNLDEQDVLDDFDDDRNIDNGEKETFTFNLKLPSDTDDGDDVRLFVKAFVDGAESTQCFQEDIGLDVQEITDKVIVESVTLSPDVPACGTTVFGTVHVVNRDKNDQDVVVTVRSDELSLSKQLPLVTLQEGFRRGSDAFLQFSFGVPASVRAGQYMLNVVANYENGASAWQRSVSVRECSATPTLTPTPTPQPTPTPTPSPTPTGGAVFTGKSLLDRFGEVPTSFWLLANIVLALAIFILALAALRKR